MINIGTLCTIRYHVHAARQRIINPEVTIHALTEHATAFFGASGPRWHTGRPPLVRGHQTINIGTLCTIWYHVRAARRQFKNPEVTHFVNDEDATASARMVLGGWGPGRLPLLQFLIQFGLKTALR